MRDRNRAMMRQMQVLLLLVAASFISSANGEAQAGDASVCERHMVRYSKLHRVPLGILYAVGLTESGRKGSLHPYAMNVEGRAVFARDLRDAVGRFKRARRDGARLIDVGCMQINHYWHRGEFASLNDMFDPEQNVAYAARFLSELKLREKTWTLAVARYHAGPTKNAAQKRYVCRVITNMVATGFAQWTRPAKRFCR
ncbi:MAG: transglycosylase SLT domain-containing protein [Aestuariivirgaceae bacterium]